MEQLEKKKEVLGDHISEVYDASISKLQGSKAEVEQMYQDVEMASEQKWTEAQSAFSRATDSFQKGINELKQLF